MKAWRVHRYDRPSLALREDEIPEPWPRAGELRVAVRALALNLNDVDLCRGRYPTVNPPLPFVPGMEVLGVVDAAAAGLEAWVGRRVAACPTGAFGGYAERALAPADMSFEVPASIPDAAGAALLIAFQTAHLLLFERARLEPGEVLLVHAAAGGVGSAALQLAVARGARVIATAGSAEKLVICRELGAELCIDYRREAFAERVLEHTRGRGADVILDLVGGEVAERSFDCIARGGRYLIGGFSGDVAFGERGLHPRRISWGNFSVLGGMMGWRSEPDPASRALGFNPYPRETGQRIHDELLALLAEKRIRPIVGREISWAGIPAGLEALEARQTIGKTIALLPATR